MSWRCFYSEAFGLLYFSLECLGPMNVVEGELLATDSDDSIVRFLCMSWVVGINSYIFVATFNIEKVTTGLNQWTLCWHTFSHSVVGVEQRCTSATVAS